MTDVIYYPPGAEEVANHLEALVEELRSNGVRLLGWRFEIEENDWSNWCFTNENNAPIVNEVIKTVHFKFSTTSIVEEDELIIRS